MVTATSSLFRDARPRTALATPRPSTAPTVAIRPPTAAVPTTADGTLIAARGESERAASRMSASSHHFAPSGGEDVDE